MATRRTTVTVAVLSTLAATVAFNAILSLAGRTVRVDLTEDRLYTVSSGVRELVASLDEPVRMDLYWSASLDNDVPQLRSHAQRVREFLDELVGSSKGMLRLRQIDPLPSSEAEDEARAAGIAALQVDGAGRTLSLGLVLRGPTDRTDVIAYLDPAQESFLEYEVARRIQALRGGAKPVVAVMSSIPVEQAFDPRNPQRPSEPPVVFQQLRQLFDLRVVPPEAPTIPEEAKVLMVVQPRGFSEDALRAIDAWAVAGKPTLAFLDPWYESDPQARQMMMQGMPGGSSFEAAKLLESWGLDIPADSVVGDKDNALRVQSRTQGGRTLNLTYLPWIALPKASLAAGDPVVGTLATINMMSAGSIRKREGATSSIEPVITSSSSVQLIPTMKLGFTGQPDQLLADFVSLEAQQTIAARVTGPIASAFAPPAADGAPPSEPAKGTANIMVVADADLLQDQTWVTEERFGNQLLGYRTIADNGGLVLNAVETLSGGSALASLRGRGESRRPFGRVEAIRQAAEERYLAEEEELQRSISESQARIGELQREKGAGQNALILSPEQEAELDKLEATVADSRKKLREVQFRLRQDIDRLSSGLMLLNVAAWPALVALLASAWTVRRSVAQRRRSAGFGGGR
jgi:ABC-type uncharacterized transport system involved in gliding motility auxiliary subunit